jgi:hypothetical protein
LVLSGILWVFASSIVDETNTVSSSISESLSLLFLLDIRIWAGYFHDAWHDDGICILRNMARRTSLFANERE